MQATKVREGLVQPENGVANNSYGSLPLRWNGVIQQDDGHSEGVLIECEVVVFEQRPFDCMDFN